MRVHYARVRVCVSVTWVPEQCLTTQWGRAPTAATSVWEAGLRIRIIIGERRAEVIEMCGLEGSSSSGKDGGRQETE